MHTHLSRIVFMAIAVLAFLPVEAGVKLTQTISREDPAFHCTTAIMNVGLDGRVYLASGLPGSYVMRLDADGKNKFGAALPNEAIGNATANADGTLATAHAHFAARVVMHDTQFHVTATAPGFLVSDAVGWDAPGHVDVGASGDFYGLDQHRDQILRISASGKVLKETPLGRDAKNNQEIAQSHRVCEKETAFYVLLRSGAIRCIGFDGVRRWQVHAGVNPYQYMGGAGGFDVDVNGVLYVLGPNDDSIKTFDRDGKSAGAITLQMGALKPVPNVVRNAALSVHNGEFFVKRTDPTELFQRYDAAGKLINLATAEHEALEVEYESDVWTAGRAIDFKINFDDGGRSIKPRWRVWAKTFGDINWRELKHADGKLQVPDDLVGVVQVKVTPEVQPLVCGLASEYLVQSLVAVVSADARGFASVSTEGNRLWFGRGEEVPLSVSVVVAEPGKLPKEIEATVALTRKGSTILSQKISVGRTPVALKLDKSVTGALEPGRYELTIATGLPLTCIGQGLEVGPGMSGGPVFRVIDYGDYSLTFPTKFGHTVWDAPDSAAAHVEYARKMGINCFVDRMGCTQNWDAMTRVHDAEAADALAKRLAEKPILPVGKVTAIPQFIQTLAARSAGGLEQMSILLYMDAGLPLGSGFDNRKPEQMLKDLDAATKVMSPFPAMSTWIWASNWWVFDKRGADGAASPQEKAEYEAAAKVANETGKWNAVLDRVADARWGLAPQAQALLGSHLKTVAPGLKTAAPGPYRNAEAYPPVSFANVDMVDLQAQFEQIDVPFHAPHSVDFYRRPGKSVLGHPEVWNDAGTGDQILPTLFQMVMRGSDSVGFSGLIPNWGTMPEDGRLSDTGMTSVYRALGAVLKQYGPWLATLKNNDRVAILAERRMFIIDAWDQAMPRHFSRLHEAYISFLHAHQPATYVFAEDIKDGTLEHYKAVILVDERVEMDPALKAALEKAHKAGVALFHDGTCRESVLPAGSKPLNVSFDKVDKITQAGDDSAYLRFSQYAVANAAAIAKTLEGVVEPVARCDNPEVLISERVSEGGRRFVFSVNNTTPALEPGHIWRVTLTEASRIPLEANIDLGKNVKFVYDIFAGRPLETNDGRVEADFRSLPIRIFEVLSKSEYSKRCMADAGIETRFGPHIRDVTISADGKSVFMNAMNWDENLYALDSENGNTKWSRKIGHYFAFAPKAVAGGLVAQGFDFSSAEGYHLYALDEKGGAQRRFALYGLPRRLPHRFVPSMLGDRINNFAAAPDGRWVATAGDLGLAVWDHDGKVLWQQDWWKTNRHTAALAAIDDQTLLVVEGLTATAYRSGSGEVVWQIENMFPNGDVRQIAVSHDGKTVALLTTCQGGMIFVLRDGKLLRVFNTPSEEAALTSDGARLAVVTGNQFKLYSLADGLQWSYSGDCPMRTPRFSPDNTRLAAASDMGTAFVFDLGGHVLFERDMGAKPVPAWLDNGDLLFATWMGKVVRLDVNYKTKWETLLRPQIKDIRPTLLAADTTPTSRIEGWSNAEPAALPLAPNVLAQAKPIIRFVPSGGWGGVSELQNKGELLFDGNPEPPPNPWLKWDNVGFFAETSPINYLLIDAFRTNIKVDAITLVEDAAHPESWLRDASLDYWDTAHEKWVPVMPLLSNAAVHTHKLPTPTAAARWRIMMPWGLVGNLRLGELVFHGTLEGCSHPDIAAGRPVAVLFDEGGDLERSLQIPQSGLTFDLKNAFSGNRSLLLAADKNVSPLYDPPFGHAIANWDMQIVEKPEAGQYRYLQFAVRAGPGNKGWALRLDAEGHGNAVSFYAGDYVKESDTRAQALGEPAVGEWRVYQVDLWSAFGKAVHIRGMRLATHGGAAAFDQVLLNREPGAVPAIKTP